jgi:hypothetical protein
MSAAMSLAADAASSGLGDVWLPVLILALVVLVAYVGMWRGWQKRARKHDLPPLAALPAGDVPDGALQADARYFGTTVSGDWLDRVVARGLGARSACRLALSTAGLDVVRPAGSFRIPADALRGARQERGIAGKVIPPHGLLVVTWEHGDYLLDSGFRLAELSGPRVARATQGPDKSTHQLWVESIGGRV